MTATNQQCVIRTITTVLPNYNNDFRTTNLVFDTVFPTVANMKKWYNSTDLPQDNKDKTTGVTVMFGYIANDSIYWTMNVSDTPSKVITNDNDSTQIELYNVEYK